MKIKILWSLAVLSCVLLSCTRNASKSIVINEICGKEFPDNEWIELFNPTDSALNLNGYYMIKVDEDGIDHVIYRFKNETLLPNQVYVVSSMKDELKRSISRKKELGIELVNPAGVTVDDFYRDDEVGDRPHPANGSYARIPNGTGHWAVVKVASRGEINPSDSEVQDALAEDLGVLEEDDSDEN